MIYRNRSSSAYGYRLLIGIAAIADGIVRLLSLGLLCSDWHLATCRMSLCDSIDRERARRLARKKVTEEPKENAGPKSDQGA